MRMKVEIWSDVVCPWCYIGKRRFEKALLQFAHFDEVEIVWHSFELDPDAPKQTEGPLDQMLARKYGISIEQAAASHNRITFLAAEEGLEYHFEKAQHGNTFNAHRLIHLAATHGKQGEMKERLMKAYFTEGLPISNTDTLVKVAGELGIDETEARAALESNAFTDGVLSDEKRAAILGITGVPFFVFDKKYGVSGAQPSEVFTEVLEKVWADAHS